MATIFAPITAITKSAVVVIRISGPKTKEVLKILTKESNFDHQKISCHKIYNPKNNQLIDQCLISFFKAPNSYTGQDVAELNLHGSIFIARLVMRILGDIQGLRIAEAGEFSKIAFLNNKLDLVQAEAVVDLIESTTQTQHRQALKQLQGDLGKIYDNWRFNLIEILAFLEAYIDFPEDDLPKNIITDIVSKIRALELEIKTHLNDEKRGQKIKEGINIVIIGAPNVGKSSLINYLAKKDIAIVSDIAGTTRDAIETHLSIADMAINICDTAGLRRSEEKIEKEGIKRAIKKANQSDIKIFVFDALNLNKKSPQKLLRKQDLELIDENTLIIINKIDLLKAATIKELDYSLIIENLEKLVTKKLKNSIKPIFISIKANINLDIFYQKLEAAVIKLMPNHDSSLITQERYRKSLQEALLYLGDFDLHQNIELAAEDLRMAARSIGKITGKVEVDNILEVIFSRFCIGK
jgi:tRNA modification GTPase